MDLKHLRESSQRLRVDADSKRQQSSQLMQNAAAHIKDSNSDRAQAEQSEATNLNEAAARLDEEAMTMDNQANDKERQVQDIEKEQARLQTEFDQGMNDLEKQKLNLIGTSSTSLF